jgi:hypothetical protein
MPKAKFSSAPTSCSESRLPAYFRLSLTTTARSARTRGRVRAEPMNPRPAVTGIGDSFIGPASRIGSTSCWAALPAGGSRAASNASYYNPVSVAGNLEPAGPACLPHETGDGGAAELRVYVGEQQPLWQRDAGHLSHPGGGQVCRH